MNLLDYLAKHRRWSQVTFGPGHRTAGLVKHIQKELAEILADPLDLEEWIDVVILGLDGALRTGASDEEVVEALRAKQEKNFERKWPKGVGQDQPSEHLEEGNFGHRNVGGGWEE